MAVVISGMGIVSPLGVTIDSFWRNLINGISGITGLEKRFSAEALAKIPVTIGGLVKEENTEGRLEFFDVDKWYKENRQRILNPSAIKWPRLDPVSKYAIVSSLEALTIANLVNIDNDSRESFYTYIGSGHGGMQTNDSQVLTAEVDPSKVSVYTVPASMPNGPGVHTATAMGLFGPNIPIIGACATGALNVGEAFEKIRKGRYGLAGGSDATITKASLSAFGNMRALSSNIDLISEEVSRPFDKDRDGFVMAEGAGVVTLDDEEAISARGVVPSAYLVDYNAHCEGYDLVKPEPSGKLLIKYISQMLARFPDCNAENLLVCAHGTSTPLNDEREARIFRTIFGDDVRYLHVIAPKSSLGHMIGAAGSVNVIICALALSKGVIPGIINLKNIDPACAGPKYVTETIKKQFEYALCLAYGFGGQNCILLLKRYHN